MTGRFNGGWHRSTKDRTKAHEKASVTGQSQRARLKERERERLTFSVKVDGFSLTVAHCAGQRWIGELCGQRRKSRRSRQSTNHAVFALLKGRIRQKKARGRRNTSSCALFQKETRIFVVCDVMLRASRSRCKRRDEECIWDDWSCHVDEKQRCFGAGASFDAENKSRNVPQRWVRLGMVERQTFAGVFRTMKDEDVDKYEWKSRPAAARKTQTALM